MTRPGNQIQTLLALGLFALLLSGCGTTYDVKAKYEIDDGTVAIVPVRDPEFGGYFGSPRGHRLAVIASDTLAREYGEDTVVRPEVYLERFKKMEEKWLKKGWEQQLGDEDVDPSTLSEQEIADKIKADFVVFCQIAPGGWITREESSVNFLQGKSRLVARLYDNRGLKIKIKGSWPVAAQYPFNYTSQDGVGALNATEDDIEEGLLKVTGRYIAELFYDHDQDLKTGLRFK